MTAAVKTATMPTAFMRSASRRGRRAGASMVAGALTLCLLAPGPAAAETIQTVDGEFEETVVAITAGDKGLVVKTPKRTVALDMVRSIEFNDRSRMVRQETPTAILTNGDRVRGALVGGDDEGIQLQTTSLGKVKVSLEILRALVIDPAMDFREVEKNLRRKTDSDILFQRSGRESAGILEKIEAETLRVEVDGASLPVKLEKVKMVLLSLIEKPEKPGKGTLVRLRLLDGSSLSGVMTSLEDGALKISNPLSETLSVRATDVQELLVLNGATQYLSDMQPSKVVQKFPEGFKYYPDVFGWKKDRSVLGGVLKLGGRTFAKGLGCHSHCSLSFELGGEYGEFRAVVGLDDSVRFLGEPGLGAVRFRVLLDGKPAKELGDEGLLKSKGEKPSVIKVSVAGAKTLTLVADYGPMLHILGRANWADAHLLKASAESGKAKPGD